MLARGADLTRFTRPKIVRLLGSKPELLARLEAAKHLGDGQVAFDGDAARVRNVLMKLARGHAAFELNEPQLNTPGALW